jgi:3D (Asp-Asp-Asp) domain-containing protein
MNRMLICVVALGLCCSATSRRAKKAAHRRSYEATAYSKKGPTSAGTRTRRGVVAADPRVLPKGSVVEVKGAGRYSGKYKVGDTGSSVKGHKIDIYVPNQGKAKQFGRKKVQVKVLKRAARNESPD